MKKYFLFARGSYQELFEYRLNFIWKINGQILSSLIVYIFWVAILGSGFNGQGFTPSSLGLYFLFVTFIDSFTSFSYNNFSNAIYRGYLATDLLKPYGIFKRELFTSCADKVVTFTIFLIVYILLRFFGVSHSLTPVSLLQAMSSVSMAMLIRFFINAFVGGLAFWFKRVHGFWALLFNLGGLFSGSLIPINFLPSQFQTISNYLPFRYLIYFPAQCLLQTLDTSTFIHGVILQIFWLFIFYSLCKIIWKLGLSEFDAAGF